MKRDVSLAVRMLHYSLHLVMGIIKHQDAAILSFVFLQMLHSRVATQKPDFPCILQFMSAQYVAYRSQQYMKECLEKRVTFQLRFR